MNPRILKIEREWVGKYIHHRNLLNKGRNELSWFTDVLKIFGVAGGLAYAELIRENLLFLAMSAMVYLFMCYMVGWWWETRHHFDLESEWGNERNPLTSDIRKAIKK